MPKRKAFFGVKVGHRPGVYEDWEECKRQVLGFPGNVYKSFPTREEAEKYVGENCIFTKNMTSFGSKYPLHNTSTSSSADPNGSCCSFPCSPTRTFKLVEEHGEQFVIFESITDFDGYFEWLSGSKNVRGTPLSRALIPNGQAERSNQVNRDYEKLYEVSDDGQLIYFKDQKDLESYLAPFFCTDLSQNGGSIPPSPPHPQNLSFQGVYQLEFHGASKGNPGQAGGGALLRCPHGNVIIEIREFLGDTTNNAAEYQSLILGLKGALSLGVRRVNANGDSQLVCMQVNGAWKVQKENLLSLSDKVSELKRQFEEFSIVHVGKSFTVEANSLANDAIRLQGVEHVWERRRPTPKCCS